MDFKFNLGDMVQFKGYKFLVFRRSTDERMGDSEVEIRYSIERQDHTRQGYSNILEDQLTLWSERVIKTGETLQEDTTVEELNRLPIGTVLYAETEQAFFMKTASRFYSKASKNTALADSSPLIAKVISVNGLLKDYIQSETVVVKFIPEV